MGIIQDNKAERDEKVIDFTLASSNNLLLIFTRNPELGKGKRRLAATVGDESALNIYQFLLNHTVKITRNLYAEKLVYYSEEIWENDIWDNKHFGKKLQNGNDLGARMANAFQEGFQSDYQKIIVIGSDMFDLSQEDIEQAFKALESNDFVVGPAEDGGYYLLGMKNYIPELFTNKDWGTETVLKDTLADLKDKKTALLETRNDVDYYEDIKDIEAFQPFLKRVMHMLGITKLFISNAAGAVNLNFKKGDMMLIEDHINLQGGSPLAFKNVGEYGERFADMSEPYDLDMRNKLLAIAKANDISLKTGVYASVVGPQLETKAEYRMIKLIGADAVGMSTVPEVIVANHLSLPIVAVSVLTDECDPDNLKPVDISEIITIAEKTEPKMVKLFQELIKQL